jgi:uncharacterized membrane protein YidH (DUF202 family)
MSQNQIIGIVLVVVGVVLLIFGMNASNSAADQISEAFTGRFTEATMWYIIGGIVLGVIGLLMLFRGKGSHA